MIIVSSLEIPSHNCESIVVVPAKAIDEAGFIQVSSTNGVANAKHEYHAMAQMAYFQYQDQELDWVELTSEISIETVAEKIVLTEGLLLTRETGGTFSVYFHLNTNKKKLLETGYRYCTRWVRLDI